MRFLCPRHRESALSDPTVAIACWEQWTRQGQQQFEQQNWKDAMPFFGCSYEVGEWLIGQPDAITDRNEINHVDRYMAAGHQLAECYGRIGDYDKELHFLLSVHRELLQLVRKKQSFHWLLREHLGVSVSMLKRFCTLVSPFKGFDDCLLETENHMKHCLN